MALYSHVPSRDELLALMVDSVYADLYTDTDAIRTISSWRAGLQYVAERNWKLVNQHL
ncbi:hypothetical protein [Nesterenkonia ebinurensis]|uniref:hypothetical protein n=1 Tax=Nesterenkonia ebinurensis TaxID=2608252 RepID=UPI00168B1FB2|nr:hypothetical protein [Nesterenkonia ebinurensis]